MYIYRMDKLSADKKTKNHWLNSYFVGFQPVNYSPRNIFAISLAYGNGS